MDQIQKSIQAKKLGVEENIDNITKGQGLPIGTMRKRPNGNFIKTSNGWKYHSSLNSRVSGTDSTGGDENISPPESKWGNGHWRDSGFPFPDLSTIHLPVGQKNFTQRMRLLKKSSAIGLIRQSISLVSGDERKHSSYRRFNMHSQKISALRNIANREISPTVVKDGKTEFRINAVGQFSINGTKVEIDTDSGFVKLGGGGNSSGYGGTYSSGYFDGQLQGNDYVHSVQTLINHLVDTKSFAQAKAAVHQRSRHNWDEIAKHLGIE